MIADLSMYDWPSIRAKTDAFWEATARNLAVEGIDPPAALARNADFAASWNDPNLLLGQTCGMPFVSGLCGDALIVARPDYGLPQARDGTYCSVIVARGGELAGTGPEAVLAQHGQRVAVNEWRSFSGHIALRAYLADLHGAPPRAVRRKPFFGTVVLSGRHLESARMIARGEADVAALDSVVWAMLAAHEPETAARLQVLDWTASAPALPFITAPRFAGIRTQLASALGEAAAGLPPVTGLPRAILPASEYDYALVRAVARRAAAEAFAPGAPGVPEV